MQLNLSFECRRFLRVGKINFQNVSEKRMQLRLFVNDMEQISISGSSESWLTADDKTSVSKVVPKTHELFRYHRSATKSKVQ